MVDTISGGALFRLDVNNGYISFSKTSTGNRNNTRWKVEHPQVYRGKTYTLSILYRTEFNEFSLYYELNAYAWLGYVASSSEWNIETRTFTLPDTLINNFSVGVSFSSGAASGDSIDIAAIKLELGEISTILNDPPQDYGVELAKCQRYLFAFTSNQIYGVRMISYNANAIYFLIPTPVTLRINPVLASSTLFLVRNMAGADQTGFIFTFENACNGIFVIATKNAHGLTDGYLRVQGAIFDANL